MKIEDTMVTKKKAYNTPRLVEHGSLVEITQHNCEDMAYDSIEGGLFGSEVNCL